MTLQDFITWDAVSDPQTQMIGGFSPEDFTMIGLTEEFERSVALFNTMFGRDLTADVSQNANPSRDGSGYPIDADLRGLIARHRAADIDLYRRAQARFTRLTSVRSVFRVGGSRAIRRARRSDRPAQGCSRLGRDRALRVADPSSTSAPAGACTAATRSMR